MIATQGRSLPGLLACLVLVFLTVARIDAASVGAQSDGELTQRQFERLISRTSASDPAFGPDDGTLIYDEGYISLQNANVDLADVLIQATFTNPSSNTRHSFDFGITFRERGNGVSTRYLTFLVLESGFWALVDPDQEPLNSGQFEDFNGRREGENTLTIYADGSTVHLGINGEYVGSAETDIVRSGDVYVGSAFFEDDYIQDGSVPYSDFTIWDLATTEETGPAAGRGDELKTPTAAPEEDANDDRVPEVETPTTRSTATEAATDTPEPSATEEPTETPEPTVTEEPTNAPEPTATEEPTDAPEPTATEEPTETPEPTVTEESTGTPEPTATIEPNAGDASPEASPEASPIAETGVYLDPLSGVKLAYDESWNVVQDATIDGKPTLQLDNGTSLLSFQTIPLAADRPLSGAVDDVIAELEETNGIVSAVVATDLDGEPIRSDGVQSSSALVNVTVEDADGDETDYKYYIEVRSIPNQPDGLLIVHAAPADEYVDQIDDRIKVTTTILYTKS